MSELRRDAALGVCERGAAVGDDGAPCGLLALVRVNRRADRLTRIQIYSSRRNDLAKRNEMKWFAVAENE
eukprot:536518-Prymnesium_polylepis.1